MSPTPGSSSCHVSLWGGPLYEDRGPTSHEGTPGSGACSAPCSLSSAAGPPGVTVSHQGRACPSDKARAPRPPTKPVQSKTLHPACLVHPKPRRTLALMYEVTVTPQGLQVSPSHSQRGFFLQGCHPIMCLRLLSNACANVRFRLLGVSRLSSQSFLFKLMSFNFTSRFMSATINLKGVL